MLIHSDAAVSLGTGWSVATWALIPVAGSAAVYGTGVSTLWRRSSIGAGISIARALSFAAGILTLVIAVASPLDAAADDALAAHMVQHLLLILVAPPLLVAGLPQVAAAWAVPRNTARLGARWWSPSPSRRFLMRLWTRLNTPWIAWVPHAAAMWFWHLPAPYQLALRNETVHGLEHLSFTLTAMLVWWTVASRSAVKRSSIAGGILVLLFTAMQSGALGALMTLAPRPWYPLQFLHGNAWGSTPLEDQQLAGLLMWVPAGMIYFGAAAALFLAWMNRATR